MVEQMCRAGTPTARTMLVALLLPALFACSGRFAEIPECETSARGAHPGVRSARVEILRFDSGFEDFRSHGLEPGSSIILYEDHRIRMGIGDLLEDNYRYVLFGEIVGAEKLDRDEIAWEGISISAGEAPHYLHVRITAIEYQSMGGRTRSRCDRSFTVIIADPVWMAD